MRKLVKIIIIALIVATAASWATTVAYGHNNDNVQLNGTIDEGIKIEAAPLETTPAMQCWANATSGVTAGDLFFLDTTEAQQDIVVTLSITNTDELVHSFRYMMLKVMVYRQNAEGQWEKAVTADGNTFPNIYVTIQNGAVTFTLPGTANYKVGIESGNVKTNPGAPAGIQPMFYLEAGSI